MQNDTNQNWEYLVKDFLDIKCSMREPEQDFLLDYLKQQGVQAESIHLHQAFSVDDKLVVIMDKTASQDTRPIIYQPKDLRISNAAEVFRKEVLVA